MYKVFIQDRSIFFIDHTEISNFDGIFVPQSLAVANKDYFTDLVAKLPTGISLYLTCEDPATAIQDFFSDHELIEAAGGIVKRKNKYLFIKRNGVWDLPKGKIEKDETPELAAKREIEEECGIVNPTVEKLISITYHTYLYHDIPTIKKTYWFELNYRGTKNVAPQAEEGISKVVWKKYSKLDKLMENTYQSVRDVVDLYFAEENDDESAILEDDDINPFIQ